MRERAEEREPSTGGGGSERQRAEERDPSLPAGIGVAEKLNRASVFSLKRRRFGFAPYRTGPDPYQNRTGNFFFWPKTGTPGVRMQRGSIRTHEVPGTGTVGFLPYRCFLSSMLAFLDTVLCFSRSAIRLSLLTLLSLGNILFDLVSCGYPGY